MIQLKYIESRPDPGSPKPSTLEITKTGRSTLSCLGQVDDKLVELSGQGIAEQDAADMHSELNESGLYAWEAGGVAILIKAEVMP